MQPERTTAEAKECLKETLWDLQGTLKLGDCFEYQIWDIAWDRKDQSIRDGDKEKLRTLYKQARGWWSLSSAGGEHFMILDDFAGALSEWEESKVTRLCQDAVLLAAVTDLKSKGYTLKDLSTVWSQ